ncbi:CatB-related O-acetyltransferase [Glutamicibacter sp. PAEs-4]|uniref:CatB-related O-acetyltransferase n=1 Tax=Glutamicibacter sp. PAEs-4 TaxID=3444114 RepID=UPI003EBF4C68
MESVKITSSFLDALYRNTILLKYNSPAPANGLYGWLKEGSELKLRVPVTIEQNVGLFGGPYKPMIGGYKGTGFATVGAFTYSYSALPEGIQIGRYCSISNGLRFIDSSHPLDALSSSAMLFRRRNNLYNEFFTDALHEYAKSYSAATLSYPKIGHDVWIGSNVTMSPKISVGTGAVLAANATVTRDVPAYAIVGGNPAKIIKYRFDEKTIDNLLASEWWDYHPQDVFSSVSKDFSGLFNKIKSRQIRKFDYKSFSLKDL